MKKVIIASTCAIFLSACGDSQEPLSTVTKEENTTAQQQAQKTNTVYFADGTGIVINGKVVKEYTAKREGRNRQHYIVDFENGIANVEGSIFSVLAEKAYTRQIKNESNDFLNVYYRKKSSPIIVANYSTAKNSPIKTRLSLSWEMIELPASN